jgi:hypothetical protein
VGVGQAGTGRYRQVQARTGMYRQVQAGTGTYRQVQAGTYLSRMLLAQSRERGPRICSLDRHVTHCALYRPQ